MLLIDANNHRKPEDADNLMDRMRELHDTTQEIDDVLLENAEEGLDDPELDDLLKEVEDSIAEDQYQTAGEQISELPQVPKQTSTNEMPLNKPKKAVTPVKEMDGMSIDDMLSNL